MWLNDEVLVSKSQNLFEDGCNDVFELNTRDVGEIMKIKIGHDDTSNSADWHGRPEAVLPRPSLFCTHQPSQRGAVE